MNGNFWNLDATAWTGIYSLLTGGLLLIAALTAGYAWRQWKTSQKHAKDQREAQIEATRPYVIVSVEPGLTSKHLFDLIIRNIGERPAVNISINLDPPPQRAREMVREESQMRNMKMLTQPMAMLAPGQEIRALYDSHIERMDHPDLPTEHRASVTYTDTAARSYEGDFVLDLEALKGMSWTEVGSIHTISQSLEKISKLLTRSRILGEKGLLDVHAVTENREDAERRDAQEKLESRIRHFDLLAKVSPSDDSLPRRRANLEEEIEQQQRDRERTAVRPFVRVYTWTLDVCRYVVKNRSRFLRTRRSQ